MGNLASLSCSENIALFHLLHAGRGKDGVLSKDSVPALPSVNLVEALPNHRDEYILSLERERSLASALAYISNIDDDPNHIPAVCIEEDHRPRDKSSLRIMLAVNRSGRKDGDEMLQRIKIGLERIFAEISQVVDECKFLSAPCGVRWATKHCGIQQTISKKRLSMEYVA